MRFMLIFAIAMILTISWQTSVFAELFAGPETSCTEPDRLQDEYQRVQWHLHGLQTACAQTLRGT
jgi:hypothetical protein